MKNRTAWIWGAVSALVLIGLDQLTKKVAEALLAGQGVVNVLGDVAVLVLAKNRGAFLSLGNQLGDVSWWLGLVVLPIVFLIGLTVYALWRKRADRSFLVIFVFIFAGGAGNLIDRVLYGEVTDFMNLGIGWLRTGIFNLADLYIVAAVAIIVVQGLLKKKAEKQPEQGA